MNTITLCGSTRFKRAFQEWNARLTLEGNRVFSVAMWSHADRVDPTTEQKELLDRVHLGKIDLSDEIFVLDLPVDGTPYIGESTRREIQHAERIGCPVRYLSQEHPDWREEDCAVWNGRAVDRPKVVTLCGSSRFVDVMAVCGWLIERDENAVALGLHLLPQWYGPDLPPHHLAEHEGCALQMDLLHLQKIDMADEVFVVDVDGYVGESTSNEIRHAVETRKPIRRLSDDSLGARVLELVEAARQRARAAE